MVPVNAKPLPGTLQAIAAADLITIGPGSLFTSIVPNLLVRGIPEAIAKSRALKVYIGNLMMQANESLGLTAADHIRAVYKHSRIPVFDYALLNTGPVSPGLQAKYKEEGVGPVECDVDAVESLGLRCVLGNFVEEGDVVRHAADRVAAKLVELIRHYAPVTNLPIVKFFPHGPERAQDKDSN